LDTDSNALYGWGGVNYASSYLPGLSGVTTARTIATAVTPFGAGKTIVDISVSKALALALMSDGTVYGFGDNSVKQVCSYSSTLMLD
jgi:alpha-tubulin suppressor-like RCC1 family protein